MQQAPPLPMAKPLASAFFNRYLSLLQDLSAYYKGNGKVLARKLDILTSLMSSGLSDFEILERIKNPFIKHYEISKPAPKKRGKKISLPEALALSERATKRKRIELTEGNIATLFYQEKKHFLSIINIHGRKLEAIAFE